LGKRRGQRRKAKRRKTRSRAFGPSIRDAERSARKEFARATADPEIIIAGAQRYALVQQMRLAQPGQTPQHTAMAKNWLREERWKDPLPAGVVLDGLTGEPIEGGAAAPRRRKLTRWQQIAEDYLAEHGDAIIN
jgi:hypothetical protein